MMGTFSAAVRADEREKVTEEVTRRVTAEVTRRVTDDVTRRVTDDVTRRVTDDVTRRVTDDVTRNDVSKAARILLTQNLPIEEVMLVIREYWPELSADQIAELVNEAREN